MGRGGLVVGQRPETPRRRLRRRGRRLPWSYSAALLVATAAWHLRTPSVSPRSLIADVLHNRGVIGWWRPVCVLWGRWVVAGGGGVCPAGGAMQLHIGCMRVNFLKCIQYGRRWNHITRMFQMFQVWCLMCPIHVQLVRSRAATRIPRLKVPRALVFERSRFASFFEMLQLATMQPFVMGVE